jgi:uncharacterized protein
MPGRANRSRGFLFIRFGLRVDFGNNAPSSDSERRGELQKIRKIWGAWILLLAASIVHADPVYTVQDLDAAFPKDVLIIEASDGVCYRFDIYLALDDPHRQRGLMFVRDLPATTGMLFVYQRDEVLTMWMKNTFIPLDMVFARRDGTVSSVVHDTEPQSLRTIASAEPVAMVLELNAGTAERLHIGEHSRLLWAPMRDQ